MIWPILFAAFSGVVGTAASAEACPPPATDSAVIVEDLDGRTLRAADGRTILLAGIEVPEVERGPTSGSQEIATAVSERIGLSGPVRLAVASPPDRYGRLHAQVFLADGRWVQAEMVRAGIALVRPEDPEGDCSPALLALEAAARAAGTGIWATGGFAVQIADDPRLSARNGLYALVEGRVFSVGFGSSMVFLDFGRDHRTDFTVMVPRPIVARLTDAGIPVDAMRGRTIRVRGVIEENGGPAIRIANPNELQVVSQRQ